MVADAEKRMNTSSHKRKAVAAEEKIRRQRKLDGEEQRKNLELQIKQRVKSRVAKQISFKS